MDKLNMNLEFTRPYVLIFIPIVIALLIWSARKMRITDKVKRIKYTTFRCMVLTLLLLALSGMQIKWSSKEVTTIFVVDCSDSVAAYESEAEQFIKDALKKMPNNNKAGVISFGKNAVVEKFVSDSKNFSGFEGTPIKTATDLETALTSAMTLFDDKSGKRIVLITDGAQNQGEVQKLSKTIVAENISFSVVKLDQSTTDEVYVEKAVLPEKINVGEMFNVTVTIQSNVKTSATVTLLSGSKVKEQVSVDLQVGENKFIFRDKQTETGLKAYRVVVSPKKDTISLNNEYVGFTQVKEGEKILLIEGKEEEGAEFAKILAANQYNYEVTTPKYAPKSLSKLNEYKAVILLNAHYDDFNQGFVANVESYVKDYAGGLIAIGGEDSFALGGYRDTSLEKVLPVYMDLKGEKEIPKMAMAMVIDHSGSMSAEAGGVTALDLAKQAAVEALDNLRKTDEVGVLVFDDKYTWNVKMQSAAKKDSIASSIARIEIGGGTSIYPALDEAVKQMKKSDAKLKHIILLTDGEDGYREYDGLLKDMNKNNITLSTVAVGDGADVDIMEYLAQRGKGRYYQSTIDSGIPRIFAKEIFLSMKSYLINEEFTPVITSQSNILDGVVDNGMPSLLGYIAATPKETATTILESHLGDPILTTWQYGLGKTVAWNSDGENKWTGNYANWEPYQAMWKNIIDSVITDTDLGADEITVTQEGANAVIHYKNSQYQKNEEMSVFYTSQTGKNQEVKLDLVGVGEYKATLPLEDLGVYNINIRGNKDGKVTKMINTAVAMQYSPEYQFQSDTTVLNRLVEAVNGRFITKPKEVFQDKIKQEKAYQSLVTLFVLLGMFWFMIDILSRRLNLHLVEDGVEFVMKAIDKKKEEKKQKSGIKAKAVVKEKVESTPVEAPKEVQKESKKVKKEKKKVPKKPKKQEPEAIDMATLLQKKKDREF